MCVCVDVIECVRVHGGWVHECFVYVCVNKGECGCVCVCVCVCVCSCMLLREILRDARQRIAIM